jgi:hypothetical protein
VTLQSGILQINYSYRETKEEPHANSECEILIVSELLKTL